MSLLGPKPFFFCQAPNDWNIFSDEVKGISDILSFKRHIRSISRIFYSLCSFLKFLTFYSLQIVSFHFLSIFIISVIYFMQGPTENHICDIGSLLKYLYYYYLVMLMSGISCL